MKKDYKAILDSLQMTGIYVIREDNHAILYYNDRVKKVAPNIREGMICHEVWAGSCLNCPLLTIGDKKESRSINYDDPFGKVVDILATRILWQDSIPAFVVAVTPHAETASYTYDRILKANLTNDTYECVKSEKATDDAAYGHLACFSGWMEQLVANGSIFFDDAERFQHFMQLDSLRGELRAGKNMLVCTYRRRSAAGYRWHTIEIVPDMDYTHENQKVVVYIKDVHDIYREGLEREERDRQNQEIIRSVGEMNFGVYVVDLRTGIFNPVRTTGEAARAIQSGVVLWDELLQCTAGQYLSSGSSEEPIRKYSLQLLRESWERGEKRQELTGLRLSGEAQRYVSVSAHFHTHKSGDGYVILVFQDIDERMRREIARSQNARRMAAIIESRFDTLNTVYLDSGVYEKLRLEKGGMEEKPETGDYGTYFSERLQHVHKSDRALFEHAFLLERIRERVKGRTELTWERYEYRIMDGQELWIQAQVFYLRQGGELTANILEQDITKQKLFEAEQERISAEKVSIINTLSGMYFATYLIDLDSCTYRTVAQREEVSRVLNNEANYVSGIATYAEKFVHPDDREEYLSVVGFANLKRELKRGHTSVSVEYRDLLRKTKVPNADTTWIRATVVLAGTEDGRPKSAIYVAQDVSDIKQREQAEHRILKEAYDAATQANASKSDFLSKMSHDIRTPLNAIIGMTTIAGNHIDNPERVSDCLNKITVSSNHLLALINEVLDMSKIESGKLSLSEEEFNLSDLVHSVLTMIRPSAQAKNHTLELHIAKVEHEEVIGDVLRLQQVFMNILGNSVKYTPNGGTLELDITEKPSRIYGYGSYEFVFKDNGIGMTEEFQKTMFDAFSRAEDSRISKVEGTGLGMTITRNIVSMMNGSISVESSPECGSQFTVTVFLKLQKAESADREAFAGLPVLVVDDDMDASETVCEILDELGMKSERVFCGQNAIARIHKAELTDHPFFAVILDWKMPGMDGIETARIIRKEIRSQVPIVILSAYDWTEIEAEARSAGVDDFISKPLFRSRLVYLFRKLTAKEREIEQKPPEKLSETAFEGRRILLVEDNELNAEIACEIIGSTGVTVESAQNGAAAVELFASREENYYDLIFMDIQMPVMNGYDASRAIRQMEREDAERIPIVAMTANAFAEDAVASKRAGMNEHITKPLDVDELMRCMNRWLK